MNERCRLYSQEIEFLNKQLSIKLMVVAILLGYLELFHILYRRHDGYVHVVSVFSSCRRRWYKTDVVIH